LIETYDSAFSLHSTFSLLEENEFSILIAINRHYAESQESIIRMNGDAETIGRSWIWAVDMVVIDDPISEDGFASKIDTWVSRIVSNGIFVVLHYEEEGYEYVKEIVDEKMKDHEQIARAGTLAAYQISDPATDISWAMINKAHDKHAVIQ
jgi:hypothetical protein